MSEEEIRLATTNEEIQQCFPTMSVLRPHLEADRFVERVRQQQAAGYQLAALYADGSPRSIAGFRILDTLAGGRIVYVDDLVTAAEAQRQGYASRLLAWLLDYARAHGCQQAHLDSAYHRHAAHRFYLGQGWILVAHHFAQALD
jgi:GNAT superfamily N-acetyltransferase